MPPKEKNNPIKKQPIPEDFELSDDEPATVSLNEEHKLSSNLSSLIVPFVRVITVNN